MTFDEIIRSFAHSDTVPVEAIRAALDDPTAFVDAAVLFLGRVAESRSSDEEDRAVSVLVHVLGEVGDERAFAPLMRVLAQPPERVESLLGDTITETLGNILISLAGDSASALEEALVDAGRDDFVRDAIFDAWTRLALLEKVPRASAKAFVLDYPVRIGLDAVDFGWSSWVDSVAALGFVDARDLAREHLVSKVDVTSFFDMPNVTLEDFEREMAKTLADPERWKTEPKYQPFTGTIDELSSWHGYSERFRQERARLAAMDEEEEVGTVFGEPYIAHNIHKYVGRNDPCPCGSGKKFKKCCLT